MRSEFSANKALFETAFSNTFQVAKKMAQAFNKKTVSSIRPEAKLADMQSMKEFQKKSGAYGKAVFELA